MSNCVLCEKQTKDGTCVFRLGCENKHELCVRCFSKISAERGCDPVIKCPNCGEKISSWTILVYSEEEYAGESRGGTQRFRKVEYKEVHTIREPDLEREPKQYHQNMAPNLFKNTSILSLNTPLVAGEQVIGQSTIAAEIPGALECADDTCDERTLSKIKAIFQWLHAKLLPTSDPP